MSSTRERIESYIKTRISEAREKVIEIVCEDLVRGLNIAPTTCYMYLKIVCKDIGGKYDRGKCIVIKT